MCQKNIALQILMELMDKAVQTLVEYAKMRSRDPYYKSPFAIAAENHYDRPFIGGKKDDITVLLSYVKE